MVEVKARDIAARVRSIGGQTRAVILFGPDQGMVRERAKAIGKQISADLNDAFQVARVTAKNLQEHPSMLADEMAAISMMGGRRLVWLEDADKSCLESLKLALASAGEGFLLVTAGDIRKTDALVKPFTAKDTTVLAIPCYSDEGGSLAQLVQSVLSQAGLQIEQHAMRYLVNNLGADRMVSRRELDKLVLYMGTADRYPNRQVTMDDVRANVGDSSAFVLTQIAESVTGGNKKGLEDGLERAWISGDNPVAILRIVQNRLLRFHQARGHMEAGMPAGAAVKKMGVFWKEADAFAAQLNRWSMAKINRAMDILLEAEEQCKTTGNPAEVICARALLSITKAT